MVDQHSGVHIVRRGALLVLQRPFAGFQLFTHCVAWLAAGPARSWPYPTLCTQNLIVALQAYGNIVLVDEVLGHVQLSTTNCVQQVPSSHNSGAGLLG